MKNYTTNVLHILYPFSVISTNCTSNLRKSNLYGLILTLSDYPPLATSSLDFSIFVFILYFQISPGRRGNQLVGSCCHHNIPHRGSNHRIVCIMEEEDRLTDRQRRADASRPGYRTVSWLLHNDRYFIRAINLESVHKSSMGRSAWISK